MCHPLFNCVQISRKMASDESQNKQVKKVKLIVVCYLRINYAELYLVYVVYRLIHRQILGSQGIEASKAPMKHMEQVLWTSRFKAFTKRKRRTQYKRLMQVIVL